MRERVQVCKVCAGLKVLHVCTKCWRDAVEFAAFCRELREFFNDEEAGRYGPVPNVRPTTRGTK